ncbi:MAG: AAA family ATPase [Lachnospiraceae bacterium]|nr:AAA family ATPase [Lachnospiraceae bacterium]
MKLEYIYLDGYKGLKDLSIQFKEQSSPEAIDFLIGRNGSGKSSVLEAIGLIFTRIMQNELPGFPFEIRYRMPGGVRICVRPQEQTTYDERGRRKKLFVEVEQDGERRRYDAIPNEYLPDRIITYCSGANSSMEEILVSSPRDSLVSDLYDLSVQEREEQDLELKNEILDFYERLDVNPRVLYLDAVTSKFVLPVLCAVLPLDIRKESGKEEILNYFRLRNMLTERLNMNMIPVAFSFQVNNDMLERADKLPQINMLRQLIGNDALEKSGSINDKVVTKLLSAVAGEDGSIPTESTVLFLYEQLEPSDEKSYYHQELQKFFDGNPFILLSTLLTAYRMGILSNIHFSYRNAGESGVYDTEAFSDGELMWLARAGLVLMSQKYCGENTLFLYDEPDVHFNDDWNKDFIKMIYELSRGAHHEFLIATHSTLILTDAMYEQVNLFDNRSGKKTEVKNINISTFAAQRDEISDQIFDTEAIGSYASDSVESMMQETDPEKMKENIEKLGPGYERFRMYEQLYALMDRLKE